MMGLILNNLDKLVAVGLLFSLSLYIRILLQLMGQAWIKTIAHTATLSILPIITYVITSVISGNIALSLGMVGALSIVRFRNPVRSPLELAVYFCAITMGITASVNLNWLLLLVGAVSGAGVALCIVNFLFKAVSGKPFFIASFSEGNALSTLTVVATSEISLIDMDSCLMSKVTDENEVSYTLASANFNKLKEVEKSIRSEAFVKSTQLSR